MSEKQKGIEELTFSEHSILNVLKNTERGERITVQTLSAYTGICVRNVYKSLATLREKGYKIASSRRKEDRGIFLAVTKEEWESFLNTRKREINTSAKSIVEMQKMPPVKKV